MEHFAGKLAVVTGGGTGMGRELARQLSAAGCHVAMCDVSAVNMAETVALCKTGAPAGTVVSSFAADVAGEQQLIAFRQQVEDVQDTDHLDLLFNNAGIGWGGSFTATRVTSGRRCSRSAGAASTLAHVRSSRSCWPATQGT